jgi:hypothetical protein
MKRTFQCALAVATLLASSSAWAQAFGEKGQIAISAERLFGITHDSATVTRNGVDSTSQITAISLLSSPSSPSGGTVVWGSYSTPRVAGDYFVINHLSVGAALGYSHWSRSNNTPPNPATTVSGDAFTFAPRAGYAIAFNDMIGIWPRAGFTYQSFSDAAQSAHDFAFTLEAPFTFQLIPHVIFWGGPTLDLGLSGSTSVQNLNGTQTSVDFNATDIGIQTGLLVYFGT